MLYYPSMHLAKLMLAHLCLGFAYDYHYVQFGGVIAAHVMYMMIQISSSGYKTKRDKIIYPFVDFIYVLFYLSKYFGNLSFYRYRAHLQCWASRIDSKTRNNRFFLSFYHDYHTYSPSRPWYCGAYSKLMRVIEPQVIWQSKIVKQHSLKWMWYKIRRVRCHKKHWQRLYQGIIAKLIVSPIHSKRKERNFWI